MTHAENSTLTVTGVCGHCGDSIALVEVGDMVAWRHTASDFYTCNLNKFMQSGKPWREYVSDPESWLAEPSTLD